MAADTDGVSPPAAKADVLEAPAPLKFVLAVAKLLVVVQLVPFHDSVAVEIGEGTSPPKAKADV